MPRKTAKPVNNISSWKKRVHKEIVGLHLPQFSEETGKRRMGGWAKPPKPGKLIDNTTG